MALSSKNLLNSEQKKAVTAINGPVLVLAGAGSGKTGVITHKIAYLIKECQYKAYDIVALTFTNKAAREMKERVSKLLYKQESKGLWVSTFHTLGLRILKEDGHFIGLNKDFSIFDQRDCFEIIKEIIKADDDKKLKIAQSQISNYKNDLNKNNEYDEAVIYAANTYNNHLLALNSVDFDDLIIHCLTLFSKEPKVLEKWQRRIRYLLLDEYQDTNQTQYALVKYLAGDFAHFTAVGDDDQSIYSWRGAEAENLKLLADDYPNLQIIKLEQNYRCDSKILSSSNSLISNNKHLFEKKLWSKIDGGEKIVVHACDTESDEAQTVVTNILIHHNRYGSSLNDYVILYRGNYQSRAIEKELRNNRIPYIVNGSTSFFEHVEVRDLLAYLRVIANPNDHRAFVRIINTPKREIGTTTVQKLSEYARSRHIGLFYACLEIGISNILPESAYKNVYEFASWLMEMHKKSEQGESPIQILDWVIGDIEYKDYVTSQYSEQKAKKRIELIDDLRDWIIRLDEKDDINSLSEIIQRMLLLDMLESKAESDNKLEAVSLMTLHAAKGLEYPHVNIVGLEEGLLPHVNSTDDDLIEEERRLLYVGMTRAKKSLIMTLAKNRRISGNQTATEPSRFLAELPQDEISWIGINEELLSDKEKQERRDNLFDDLFSIIDEN